MSDKQEKTTARIALDVHPEVKAMLRKLADDKGENMTQTVERLIRGEVLKTVKSSLKN